MTPVLDLCFPILRGRDLEVDHGQALLAALSAACADLERIPGLGVHTVRGTLGGVRGELNLTAGSEVRLRVPAEAASRLLGLAGAELDVHGHPITLGEPRYRALAPVSALWARTVTIHFQLLGAAARAQLALRLARDFPWGAFRVLRARTIRVGGRQVLGFEVAVRGLRPGASLLLQAQGFGGRRVLGCGLFVPFSSAG